MDARHVAPQKASTFCLSCTAERHYASAAGDVSSSERTCRPSHVVVLPSTGTHCTAKTANVTTRSTERSHPFAGSSAWVRLSRLRVRMLDAHASPLMHVPFRLIWRRYMPDATRSQSPCDSPSSLKMRARPRAGPQRAGTSPHVRTPCQRPSARLPCASALCASIAV